MSGKSDVAISLMDQLAEHEESLRNHSTTQSMTPQVIILLALWEIYLYAYD